MSNDISKTGFIFRTIAGFILASTRSDSTTPIMLHFSKVSNDPSVPDKHYLAPLDSVSDGPYLKIFNSRAMAEEHILILERAVTSNCMDYFKSEENPQDFLQFKVLPFVRRLEIVLG